MDVDELLNLAAMPDYQTISELNGDKLINKYNLKNSTIRKMLHTIYQNGADYVITHFHQFILYGYWTKSFKQCFLLIITARHSLEF